MTTVAKGSHVKLAFQDGSTIEWQAHDDMSVERAVETLQRLSQLDRQSVDPGSTS